MTRGTEPRRAALLVGEAPGPRTPPEVHIPLYPNPPNCAGARLQRMTGLGRSDYLRAFARTNLFRECPERWSQVDASERVRTHLIPYIRENRIARVVLFGAKVAAAVERELAVELNGHASFGRHLMRLWATLPHPSGRNLWYNKPENVERVREFFRVDILSEFSMDDAPSYAQVVTDIRAFQRGERRGC